MDKKKKQLLVMSILCEVVLVAIVMFSIIMLFKVPNSPWQLKVLFAGAALFGLFQIVFLIPSYLKELFKK